MCRHIRAAFVVMNNTTLICLIVAAVFGIQANATKVNDCNGNPNPDTSVVSITDCDEQPCKLKKGSTTIITEKFTPDHDIAKLTTRVWAKKWVWMAYPGVDDTSACDKIYFAADNSPASCPLKKGVNYIYKHQLYVDPWYPSIDTIVHWTLQENSKDIACFQVPASISS